MIDFFSEGQPQKPVTQITLNHLKVTMNLTNNLKQQETLIKATTETYFQDRPNSDAGKIPSIGT